MAKTKGAFAMPRLFWIMAALLVLASLATHIVPAGEFAVSAQGNILADEFSHLGCQAPVSPWQMIMMILAGLNGSSSVIWAVLCSGAMTAVVMGAGAIDGLPNRSICKLKDKNENIPISILFILMVYLGGFGGTDALIAVVPIGAIFCKKTRLDPICAMGVAAYATLIGFGTGPAKQNATQMLMGVPVYGAFFAMFISMNAFMIAGLFFLLSCKNKIRKDPAKSLMLDEGWNPGAMTVSAELGSDAKLSARSVAILALFLGQYGIIVARPWLGGDSAKLLDLMVALSIIASILCGMIGKFSFNKIGDEFAKGLQGLAFIGFAIGLARAMSLVLADGHILHAIAYALTRPLMALALSISSIGMTSVIAVINPLVPSATSKAAILVPVLKPMAQALRMSLDLAVQAFQYGDGFTNLVSPFLGWTAGSCVMAGVPFPKWAKWELPKVLCLIAIGFAVMFILSESGWTAF